MQPAVFDPDVVVMLRRVLNEAWDALPEDRRVNKSEMAVRLLKRAAAGERDEAKLRAAAMIDVVKSRGTLN